MPFCECALNLQQGPRLASSPQAVLLALRPLALGRLVAIVLLAVLSPWSCLGLRGNTFFGNVVYNGTVDFQVLQGQWKDPKLTTAAISYKSGPILSPEKNVRDVELKVEGQAIHHKSTYETSKPIFHAVSPDRELIYSRHPRSSLRHRWATEIERRERLQTHANSHILVLDAEQVRYMYRKRHRIFSFSVKEITWLEVVLTPCTSNVTWSFLGPGSGYMPQQREQTKVLFSYTGGNRQSFKAKLSPNLYRINVTSLNDDYDSQVYIYLNTATGVSAGGGLLYPPLPPDAQVHVKTEGTGRATRKLHVSWNPAITFSQHLRLEYCLAISSIENFRTHCAALAYAKGVERPKQARWGSRADYRRRNKARDSFARSVSASPKNMFYTCIGNKTSFTFTDGLAPLRLRRGKRYYINVFVKNVDKNTLSAYKGTSAKIKRKIPYNLKVGESRTFALRQRKRPVVEIMLNATFPKLVLEIISCQGKIPVQISQNGTQIRKKRISKYKQFVIPNKHIGEKFVVQFPLSYRMRKNSRGSPKRRRQKKKQSITYVTLSLPPRKSPIKKFPTNSTVSVQPHLSKCNSVTLKWQTAGSEYKYCVYYVKVGKTLWGSRETKDICRAAGEEPRRANLSSCIEYREVHSDLGTLTHTVEGLDPGTCYRFDVLLKRDGMVSVPYDSVRVRTPRKCRKTKTLKASDFSCLPRRRRKGLHRKSRRRNG